MSILDNFSSSPGTKGLKDFFKNISHLSSELPYDEFLSDGNILVLKDQSLGVIYEVDLVEHEACNEIFFTDLNKSLKNWLNLPSDFRLQYLFSQERLSDKEIIDLSSEEALSGHNELADFLHEKRVESLIEKSKNEYPLFKRKGYLLIKQVFKKEGSSLRDKLPQKANSILFQETKKFIKQKKNLEKTLNEFESMSPVGLKRIDAKQTINLIKNFIYGSEQQSNELVSYTNSYSMSEQIIDRGLAVDFKGKCSEKSTSRTLSLKVPAIKYPSMGAWYTTLSFPLQVSLQLIKPSKGRVDLFLNWKEFSLKNSLSETSKREYEEVREIKKKLAFDEEAIWVTHNIFVEGKDEDELEDRVNQIKRVCSEKFDVFCIVEEDIGLALWWDSLPFNYSPIREATYQRALPILSKDLVEMLPLYDSSRGIGKAFQVLQSREGNVAPLSLFELISSHSIFLGDTGTGKSRFVGEVLCNAKRPKDEYLVFIIEMKTSYPMLVNFFGGEVNRFKIGEPPKASPFKGVYDEEKMVFLTNWIKTAVELTSPSFVIESELKEAIYQSIKSAVNKKMKAAGTSFVDGDLVDSDVKADITLNFDNIGNELSQLPSNKQFENLSDKIEELLSKLAVFRGDGIYASFFRPTADSIESSATTFLSDFDGLKSDPVMRDLTFLAEFEKIRQIRMMPEHQGKETIIILDEIADLDRGIPMFADIISSIAETGRKEGIWVFSSTCVPSVFNDEALKACKTCLRVATNYIFTAMSDENLSELEKDFEIIDERDKAIIGSLKTVNGKHSEIYIIRKDGKRAVFRLVESSTKRWLQPTSIKETRESLKALKKFDGDSLRAAQYLDEKFPNGVA